MTGIRYWWLIVALASTGCKSGEIEVQTRHDRQMYLLKTCVEKGGFPEVDRFQDFVACRWPEVAKPEGKTK